MTVSEVLQRCKSDTGGPAFARPLSMSDREQVRIMQAMNGPRMYCSNCYATAEFDPERIGQMPHSPSVRCSGAIWLPGAQVVEEFVRYRS